MRYEKEIIMKAAVITVLIVATMMGAGGVVFADWSLPLSITAGGARTNLTLGISGGATDGYDQGLDSPLPVKGDTLNAGFPHPEWNISVGGGTAVVLYHRDIRGTLPQDFYCEVTSLLSPVVIKWDKETFPEKTVFLLYDHAADIWVDMTRETLYSFSPSVATSGFTVRAAWGDLQPPSAPSGFTGTGEGKSFFMTWDPNAETDLAGYKIHFGSRSRTYEITIDLKAVNNYTPVSLMPGTYYLALTAYDKAGNESPYSQEIIYEVPAEARTAFTINGTVRDGSGAAVGGVTVGISDEAGTPIFKTVSDPRGLYVFAPLIQGRYVIKGQAKNYIFKPVHTTLTDSDVSVDIVGERKKLPKNSP